MSAINFPNNPSINDEFTQGEKVWRWNGFRWRAIPISLINVRQQIAQANAAREAVEQTLTTAEQTISGLSNGMDGKAEAVHSHVISDVTNLQTGLDAKATTVTYAGTITSGATWADQTGFFTTSITVAGITATDNPIVDLNLASATVANIEDIQAAWGTIYRVVTSTDTLTFHALEAPTFPENTAIQIKVVR